MLKLHRSLIPAAVLVAALGTGTAAGASAAVAQRDAAPGTASPAVMICGTGPAVTRPASLILTCADDGELAEHLAWSSWTASQATATGVVTWRDCESLCADARQWESTSAEVTLTDPVNEPGIGVLFTRLNLNVTGSTPPGFQRTLAFSEAPVPAMPSAPASGESPAPGEGTGPAAAPSGSLDYARIEGYWVIAGGPDGSAGAYTQAQVAAAITGAESSFLPGIIQPDVDYCGGGADRAGWGLWQITCGNSVAQFGRDFQILDPWNNAEAAVYKCKQDEAAGYNCFTPWSTWASGAYLQFLKHTAPNRKITDPGEYVQINATPPGTPEYPKAHPGSHHGPPMPGSAPKAAFAPSVNYLLQDQPVVFNGSGSKAGNGGKIASYSWKFGDGATASGAEPTHEFVTSAEVSVTLTVTDSDGLRNSVSHSYFVLPGDSSASNYVAGSENQEHVFYESSAGALEQSWFNTKQWANQTLTGSPQADPVTLNYQGEEHVFDIGSGGAIEQNYWNGSAWVHQALPGTAAKGSQLGGTDYVTGSGVVQQHVFFTGSNGSLQQSYWNGKTWTDQTLPGKPDAGSPVVSALYITGSGTLQQHVFFIGSGGTLQQTYFNGKTWLNQTLPGTPAPGQNALATADYLDGSTMQQHVFFIGSGGTLQQTYFNGSAWANQTLPGSPVLSGGLVTSNYGPSEQHVFFTGSGNTLQQSYWNGKTWTNQTLPGTAGRVLAANDYLDGNKLQQHVFFAAQSGGLEQSYFNGTSWTNQTLPGPAVAS
jgi:hypothetical protein